MSGAPLDWAWAAARLRDARAHWVATTGPDGRPHAMPVWALLIDDTVLFSTSPSSVKGRGLSAVPYAVVHVGDGDVAAVVVEGPVERLEPAGELWDRFVDAYQEKYAFGLRGADPSTFAFYRVRPAKAFAFREADFSESRARFEFDADGRPVPVSWIGD